MARLRRTGVAVTAGLLVGAAAVAGLAVGGGNERSAVVAGSPERGRTVDPATYLRPQHHRELAESGLAVYAPRWLPDWTARADFSVYGSGFQPNWDSPSAWAAMEWTIPYTATDDPLVRDFGGDLTLDVSASATPASLAKKASGLEGLPVDLPPCGDRIGLLNKPCLMEGKARTYVFTESGLDENLACVFDGPPETWPEDDISEASVRFLKDGVGYSVTLRPGPGCSKGHFTVEDLLAVADSLAPVEAGEQPRSAGADTGDEA